MDRCCTYTWCFLLSRFDLNCIPLSKMPNMLHEAHAIPQRPCSCRVSLVIDQLFVMFDTGKTALVHWSNKTYGHAYHFYACENTYGHVGHASHFSATLMHWPFEVLHGFLCEIIIGSKRCLRKWGTGAVEASGARQPTCQPVASKRGGTGNTHCLASCPEAPPLLPGQV